MCVGKKVRSGAQTQVPKKKGEISQKETAPQFGSVMKNTAIDGSVLEMVEMLKKYGSKLSGNGQSQDIMKSMDSELSLIRGLLHKEDFSGLEVPVSNLLNLSLLLGAIGLMKTVYEFITLVRCRDYENAARLLDSIETEFSQVRRCLSKDSFLQDQKASPGPSV